MTPAAVSSCRRTACSTSQVVAGYCRAAIRRCRQFPGRRSETRNLIAPRGTVDAGAAGIRFSGNLNIASLYVTNAFNIQVQGVTTGVLNVAAPNTIALTAASNTAGAATDLATQAIKQQTGLAEQQDVPSFTTVEVLGYGGPNDD
jgi:hypothetical protein